MKTFLINKLEWILTGLVFLFLISYVLFSSLSTSLDFKIDKLSRAQLEAKETNGNFLTKLAQAQGSEGLAAAGKKLNLVEVVLADGYIDIRSPKESDIISLAKNKR